MTKSEYEEIRDRPGRDETVTRGKKIVKDFLEIIHKLIEIERPGEKITHEDFAAEISFYFWKWFSADIPLPPILTVYRKGGLIHVLHNLGETKTCSLELEIMLLLWMAQGQYIEKIATKEAACAFSRKD